MRQKVPTLLIDGHFISQSGAILEYLEQTRPHQYPLLPEDAFECAKIRNICGIIGCDIQPLQNLSLLRTVSLSFYLFISKYVCDFNALNLTART